MGGGHCAGEGAASPQLPRGAPRLHLNGGTDAAPGRVWEELQQSHPRGTEKQERDTEWRKQPQVASPHTQPWAPGSVIFSIPDLRP